MSLKIRLTRMGSKKRPYYRIVALDSATRRDGRPLEFLGHYNPMTNPPDIQIDKEKLEKWTASGAQPSETVRALIKQAGL